MTLRALTAPDTSCSINVGYPAGPQLGQATSDAAGDVAWTWRVKRQGPGGSWPITVTCANGSATTHITLS